MPARRDQDHVARAVDDRISMRRWVVGALLLAAISAACGEEVSDADASLALPGAADTDGGGFTFGSDAEAGDDGTAVAAGDMYDDPGPTDAAGPVDAEPGDGDSGGDGGDGASGGDDATPADSEADTAPAPVTSCKGHCGVFLEGNACHCHHGCLGAAEGCCGGDAGFLATCGCLADADCNDTNPCTTDSCQQKGNQKYCMNLPFAGCCLSDGECSGGDGVCTLARCIDGGCTLQPKDCSDGVDCTLDACDPKEGACSHTISAASCHIDGGCWKAGDAKPGTGGCQRCKPDTAQEAWTAEPNKCFIDGACYDAAAKASAAADECRTCQPQKQKDGWSVGSGQCYVEGACVADGAAGPGGSCQVCDSSQSQTGWSGKPGTCAVGGACYDAGAASPAGACATCQPAVTTAAFTPVGDSCLIDGACVAKGAAKVGSGGCEVCDPATSKSAWKGKIGQPCDDGDPCTKEDACSSKLACQGKQTTTVCCKADADCASQVQPGACQKAVCKGDGSCAVVADPLCCASGICCDASAKQLLPKGTICNADPKFVEYKCEDNKGYKRLYGNGCTGDHPTKCSSAVKGYGEWTALANVDCEAGKTCTTNGVSSPVCK